jgi:hypothetical protein
MFINTNATFQPMAERVDASNPDDGKVRLNTNYTIYASDEGRLWE